MKSIAIIVLTVFISSIGFAQEVNKRDFSANRGVYKIKNEQPSFKKKGQQVVIFNPKFGEVKKAGKMNTLKLDFTTKRFGKGYLVFKFDNNSNIYSIAMPAELNKRMHQDLEDEDFIVMMTGQEYLDGLKKCANKSSSAGAVICAIRHTVQMYKDCIQATKATEHIHCW